MPTYDCNETADSCWLAVAAWEPKFIASLALALQWPGLPDLMEAKKILMHAPNRQILLDDRNSYAGIMRSKGPNAPRALRNA